MISINARNLLKRMHAGQSMLGMLAADEQLRSDLYDYLEHQASIERGRQVSALEKTLTRSKRKREAIRTAIEHLQVERPQLSCRELAALIRRRTKASDKLIRSEMKGYFRNRSA